MSANVNRSPHRYGPSIFCRSISIIFKRFSRSVEILIRLTGDWHMISSLTRFGRLECLRMN